MNGLHIPRTPIVVDFWRERKAPPRALYFLSHMHADHTSGLRRTWPHPIHCTAVTAALLRRQFNIDPSLVVELAVGEARLLHVSCPGGSTVTVTVTTIDANHCPGSAMFLFEGYFGRILYTGDFRLSPAMLSHPALNGSKSIDTLYLDNTYCHPSCQFPSREDACSQLLSLLSSHPHSTILIGMHSLGKEDLLIDIATTLNTWIGIDCKRMETLKVLELADVFSTDMSECRVRVHPFHTVRRKLMAELEGESSVLAVLPTCLYIGDGALSPPSLPGLRVVPVSDHSSFDELCRFVAAVRPRAVRPIVHSFSGRDKALLSERRDMSVFNKYLDPSPSLEFDIPQALSQLLSMTQPPSSLTPPLRPLSPLTSSSSFSSSSSQLPLVFRRRHASFPPRTIVRQSAKGVQYVLPSPKRPREIGSEGCGSASQTTKEECGGAAKKAAPARPGRPKAKLKKVWNGKSRTQKASREGGLPSTHLSPLRFAVAPSSSAPPTVKRVLPFTILPAMPEQMLLDYCEASLDRVGVESHPLSSLHKAHVVKYIPDSSTGASKSVPITHYNSCTYTGDGVAEPLCEGRAEVVNEEEVSTEKEDSTIETKPPSKPSAEEQEEEVCTGGTEVVVEESKLPSKPQPSSSSSSSSPSSQPRSHLLHHLIIDRLRVVSPESFT